MVRMLTYPQENVQTFLFLNHIYTQRSLYFCRKMSFLAFDTNGCGLFSWHMLENYAMNKIAFYHGHLRVSFHLEYVRAIYLHCMYTAADITTNLISVSLCLQRLCTNTLHSIPSCLSLTAAYNDKKEENKFENITRHSQLQYPDWTTEMYIQVCQPFLCIFEEDPALLQKISEEVSSTSQGTF